MKKMTVTSVLWAATRGLLPVLALLPLCWAGPALGQQLIRQGTIKMGMNRLMTSGATFSVVDDATGTTGTNTGSTTGNEIFFEYIVFGRLGVEGSTTLTRAVRDYQLEDSGATLLADVQDSARQLMFGLNLYLSDHEKGGLKYYFGLATGQVYVTQAISGSGTFPSGLISHQVPVNTLKLGVDWIRDRAGLRLQLISQTGSTTDRSTLGGYTQTIDYTATVLAIGAFAFF